MKIILKWIGIGLGSVLFLYILTHPWLRMDRIEFYVAYKTWAENVKSQEYRKYYGEQNEQSHPGMRITIIGSNDLEYLAFNYDKRERWRAEMEILARDITAKLKEKGQLDIDELEIEIKASNGRFGLKNFSPRRNIYFHTIN